MARKLSDPGHVELKAVLEGMLEGNETITVRSVVRLHSSLKSPSDITRNSSRMKAVEEFQGRQTELRRLIDKVKNVGVTAAAREAQVSNEKIAKFVEGSSARVASHLQMIKVVAELGGTAKLLAFYAHYSNIRDALWREGALPPEFGTDQ